MSDKIGGFQFARPISIIIFQLLRLFVTQMPYMKIPTDGCFTIYEVSLRSCAQLP